MTKKFSYYYIGIKISAIKAYTGQCLNIVLVLFKKLKSFLYQFANLHYVQLQTGFSFLEKNILSTSTTGGPVAMSTL